MSLLFIDRKNARLHVASGMLRCSSEDERDLSVPLKLLQHVVITGKTQMDSVVLRQMLAASVGISLLNVSRPSASQVIYPGFGGDVLLRLNQYRHSLDEDKSLLISQAITGFSLLKLVRVISQWRKKYPAQRLPLTRAVQKIKTLRRQVGAHSSLDSLRGLEGTAARLFWQAFAGLVPQALAFSSRQRRPPPDPVNALLSLSFTLLHHRAVLVCVMHGLDPLLGFQHRPLHSRESLACDLAEPFRPLVADWVLRQFRQGFFTADDFGRQNRQGCRLKKAARQRYFSHFHYELASLQRAMALCLRLLKKHVRADENGVLR